MILSILNRTAAEIAAAALFELFPNITLLERGGTSVGFFCDFRFPHLLPPGAEVLVEEKMRQIARERRPIRILEMVPLSAREFLIKEKQGELAKTIDFDDGLVEIFQMDSFVSLSSGPHLKNSNEISAFKLWPMEVLQKGSYRLTGCAFAKKEELKIFLKRVHAYKQESHLAIGERKNLVKVCGESLVWLEDGIKGQGQLIETLKEHLFKNCLEIRLLSSGARIDLHASLAEEMKARPLHLAEVYQTPIESWSLETGLLDLDGGDKIQISSYCLPQNLFDTFISSLQSVEKTLNILGFKCSLLLVGRGRSDKSVQKLLKILSLWAKEFNLGLEEEGREARLDFLVEDRLGRKWAAFSFLLAEKGFYLIGSIERLYALLLERVV